MSNGLETLNIGCFGIFTLEFTNNLPTSGAGVAIQKITSALADFLFNLLFFRPNSIIIGRFCWGCM